MQTLNTKSAVFTEQMKQTHTILVPNMLPIQLKLMIAILENYGYKMELLETEGPSIVEYGLKNVHNDTCYPALLVIGQLIDALHSGKYDLNKVALILPQTGGGCRASNYIHLMRKALKNNGLEHIPVISLNTMGLESSPGFKITPQMMYQILYALILGDLIMHLYHQTRPYEVQTGASQKAVDNCISVISKEFNGRTAFGSRLMDKLYDRVIGEFSAIKLTGESKVKVGIVGEIYVKFSPLGNNNLEEFLLSENAEVVMPGLLDFCLYCIYGDIQDRRLYGRSLKAAVASKAIYKFILSKQRRVLEKLKGHPRFRNMTDFEETRRGVKPYINLGAQMGEGWLLTGEMVELAHSGVRNIICTQPFGCLPNHIVGKGMIRQIKEKNPGVNIISIDYDPGASRINQENRIKLMLAAAK
ncbi:MAG: 2-hydroxyacyl-CoA dehydratase [Oscillospiraceae bacterium]|nr:2-hydroxyacyl-CoA dehydratase [Oscillospiraceae bacterium]